MCAWLSCAEWCDVRLQCGGGGGAAQELQAHRAVLASVSDFLRRILLSCSNEEAPTFIVLPDFDLEAMSSVLYYIYNGEVVIKKNKLETFMEIARAMQIYVDDKYLPEACQSAEDSILLRNNNDKSVSSKEIFCLGNGPFVKLQKDSRICYGQSNRCKDWAVQDKQADSYNGEKNIAECDSWSKRKCFRKEQSAHGDRQRSSLRDIFMETYPQNGNANGWLTSVPAIPSGRYRLPPSYLPTNANGTHLSNDTYVTAEILNKSDTSLPENIPNQLYAQKMRAYPEIDPVNYALLSNLKNKSSAISLEPKTKYEHISKNINQWNIAPEFSQLLPERFQTLKPCLSLYESVISTHFLNNKFSQRMILLRKETEDNNSKTSKGAIFNHVLESPWCPRQPTNYRPTRRELSCRADVTTTNIKEKALNDDNNNVQTSSNTEDNERICANTVLGNANAVPTLLNSNDFKCTVCDQVFTDTAALSIHTRRHSAPAKYSCTECSKSFSQLRNFKYHMSIHRGTREFAATCTVCGKYFNDRGYLSSHMKIHRNRKEYKCSQCPKSFNQRVAYNMHVRIHTGVKPHVCGECGKAFSRKMLLKQHLRTHSGERPYACPHCDKRFADRSNMTLHLRLHTGIKPFSCTMCPKSFTKKHHLKSHLNFHTGAKPYSCPKCKLAFTQSSNMRTHLKKCTAPDPNTNAETLVAPRE